ncbi:MAG: hypothetical protein V1746_03790 [bacterium]
MKAVPNLEVLVPLEGASGSVDSTGVTYLTQKYVCRWEYLIRLCPKPDDPHHIFTHLKATYNITFVRKGPYAEITVEFAGMKYDVQNLPQPVYSFTIEAGEEPIDAHPKWDQIVEAAGGEDKILWKDTDKKVFEAFKADALTNLAGVQTYLTGTFVWRESRVTFSMPSLLTGAFTVQSPPGYPPALKSGCQWLYVPGGFTKEGGVYRVESLWKASGSKGWHSVIYS